jgi:hypothetical protein
MQRVEQRAHWIRSFGLRSLMACCLIAGAARAEQSVAETGEDACSGSSTAKDPEAARVEFRAGQTAFSEGAYARAIELWNRAYRDDCTAHALLLNLAMAQELLGEPGEAIHTLQLFNRRSPASPYVDANAKRIQRLQLTTSENTRERPYQERPMWVPVARPTFVEDDPGLSLPLAVAVAGGAVTVVGAILFIEGRNSAASADEDCGASRRTCMSIDGVVDGERARARAEVGGWIAGAGLVTLAGGLTWHFLGRPQRPFDQRPAGRGLSLSADLPTAGAALRWSGQF